MLTSLEATRLRCHMNTDSMLALRLDFAGRCHTMLNMVDMGTTFHLLHVTRKGKNATSS